ncbi:MAG: hypothetical protein WD995_00200 [Gemmatimonadota bacterium]
MEQLPLLLNIVVAVLWLAVLVDLVRHPPRLPRSWGTALRRTIWGVAAILALLAGGWGPQIWRSTTITAPPDPGAGQPVESISGMVRTPFAIVERTASVDGEGRVIRNQRTTTLQLPWILLVFLAGAGWLQWRGRASLADRSRTPGGGATLAMCTTLLAATLGAACGGDGSGSLVDRPERRMVDVRWDTLLHMRSEVDDSVLFHAGKPTADASGFWVADIYGSRIARFDWEGRLIRYVGAYGSGPGEIRDFRLMDVDDQETLWVLDLPNRRISGFDTDGRLVDEIALGDLAWTPDAFAVTGDGQRFLFMETLEQLAAVVIDREGTMTRGTEIPVPDAGGAWGMALQGHATRERGGDMWVYAFASGDGFFRLSDTEVVGPRVRYPEAIPFPNIIRTQSQEGNVTSTTTRLTNRKAAAGSLWAQDGQLYIAFRGETEHEGRLLERYDLETGRYLDTVLLPRRGRIAMWEDRIIVTGNDPVPEVLVLRRVD